MKTPFLGGTYEARSLNLNAQRCINLYPEIVDTKDGKEVAGFFGTPGLDELVQPAIAEVRGMCELTPFMYAVIGNTLYEISTGYVATARGTLLTSNGIVSMDDNGLQVAIADGSYFYIYTIATATLTQVGSVNANTVAFIDTYFAFNIIGTGQWGITGQYDGTVVDPLDYITAEGKPDDVLAVIADHREVWAFGTQSTEIYVNTGAADFPFEATSGRFIEQGIVSPYAVAKFDGSLAWVGQDEKGCCIVWYARGYNPGRISTHALEKYLSSVDLNRTIVFSYQQEGHENLWLTSPDWDTSWVYDASTRLWHERAYFNSVTSQFERHRANCFCFFNNEYLVGDHSNGKIYRLNLDTYTDAGDTKKWLRSWPALPTGQSQERVIFSSLQVDCETGVGLASGQGSDPQMILRYSDDGGHTWSNERWRSMGRIGEYGARVKWRRLGMSRKKTNRIFEISGTDPVKIALIGADINQ
jgi:hypothetical protein